VKKQARSGAIV